MKNFDPTNMIVLIILLAAGVALQSTKIIWAGVTAQNNAVSGQLILKGWPYLAYLSVPVGNPPQFNEDHWNARLLTINILITNVLVIICYFGWTNIVRPKIPMFSMFELLAGSVAIAVAIALMFGPASKFLTANIGMGFWVLEISMAQRPIAQQAIVAILISISVYTLIIATVKLLDYIRVLRS